jgi:hypothetical protein
MPIRVLTGDSAEDKNEIENAMKLLEKIIKNGDKKFNKGENRINLYSLGSNEEIDVGISTENRGDTQTYKYRITFPNSNIHIAINENGPNKSKTGRETGAIGIDDKKYHLLHNGYFDGGKKVRDKWFKFLKENKDNGEIPSIIENKYVDVGIIKDDGDEKISLETLNSFKK